MLELFSGALLAMEPERRSARRTRTEELPYIEFEPEGGGIVLNASNQGIAFQTACAIRQSGPIRLSISPNPEQRIELTGEIVWMGETKTCGGLRFSEPPVEIKDQICEWLSRTNKSEYLEKKTTLPSSAALELPGVSIHSVHEPPQLPSATSSSDDFVSDHAGSPKDSATRVFSAKKSGPLCFSLRKPVSEQWPRLAIGFVICVLVFVPAILAYAFRRDLGNSLIHIGEKLGGDNDFRISEPPPSMPAKLPSASLGNFPPVSDPGPESFAPQVPAPEGVGSTDSGREDRPDKQLALHLSAKANSWKGRSVLAQRLWSAIGAGDSTAEMKLAQLYLNGDGVPKSCDQARVLLKAASKNGYEEARQELRKLSQNGCRRQ